MRRTHGFTLLELAVTIAIVGILATVAYGVSRAAYRNANLGSTVFDMAALLSGLKSTAITEQKEYLFVVTDADDPANCDALGNGCGHYFVLTDPDAAYTSLRAFDPASPRAHATLVEQGNFPRGVALVTPSGTPPAPFGSVAYYPSDLTAATPKKFAIRFVRDGSVTGLPASPGITGPWPGVAFALGADADPTRPLGQAADRKGIVVAFPSGVSRTFSAP